MTSNLWNRCTNNFHQNLLSPPKSTWSDGSCCSHGCNTSSKLQVAGRWKRVRNSGKKTGRRLAVFTVPNCMRLVSRPTGTWKRPISQVTEDVTVNAYMLQLNDQVAWLQKRTTFKARNDVGAAWPKSWWDTSRSKVWEPRWIRGSWMGFGQSKKTGALKIVGACIVLAVLADSHQLLPSIWLPKRLVGMSNSSDWNFVRTSSQCPKEAHPSAQH